jgi:hypothetical protein
MMIPGLSYEHYDQNTARSTLPALPPPLNERLGQLGEGLYDRIMFDNGVILNPWQYRGMCARYKTFDHFLDRYTSILDENDFREIWVKPYINCHFASYSDGLV